MRCRHMAANHPNLAVPIPPGDLQNGQAASAWSLPKPAFLLPTPLRSLHSRLQIMQCSAALLINDTSAPSP